MTKSHLKEIESVEFIDIYQILLALWRGKWILLSLAVLFASIAGAISLWLLTPQYQASALVIVQFPRVPSGIASYLPAHYTVPDMTALVETLRSEEVLQQVAEAENASGAVTGAQLRAHARVETIGRMGLRLTLQDTDPQRVARLVNRWARMVDDELRKLYALDGLERQWRALLDEVQQEYEAYNAEINALLQDEDLARAEMEWEALIDAYVCAQARQATLQAARDDIDRLQQEVQQLDADAELPPDLVLRIWTITHQARPAAGCLDGAHPPIALTLPTPGLTAQGALRLLAQSEENIATALSQVAADMAALNARTAEIQQRRLQYEERIQDLEWRRTRAWTIYHQFRTQQIWLQHLQQEGAFIQNIQWASPPSQPFTPNPLANMLLSAILGLFVGGLLVLGRDRSVWLHPGGDAKP